VATLGNHRPDDGVPLPHLENTASGADARGQWHELRGVGVGPPPFSVDHPPLAGHPFIGMMLEPPAPPSEVEWTWMVAPPSGTLEPPTLLFGSPLVVVPALVVIPSLAVRVVDISGWS